MANNFQQVVTYTVDGVSKVKTIMKNSPAAATRALIKDEPTAQVVSIKSILGSSK
jgi:thiamine monophosphate synthase